ncbi:MAG: DUF2851 family protein, partial [Verrucomicrobiales bacterium]|nr:DUF2851 family protein [Verrucomicrobiales bacterium]
PAPLQLPEAKTGRCATPLAGMEETRLVALLTAAAQFRLQEKAQRIRMIAEAHSRDQALFQSVAEALGFRHNKINMTILTQRLPIARLRNRPAMEREALLFGAAGFIGHEQFDAAEDPNARGYLKELWDHWWKLRGDFEPEPDRFLDWKIAGTRPTNHPQRRLGALAALLEKWPTFSNIMKRESAKPDWQKQVRDLLGALNHDFWETHYTLRSKPAGKPLTLLGKDRIRDILGNILFPLAVSDHPGENWIRYCELPGSDSNESLRRACLRLFGPDSSRAKEFTKRYFQQQALLQIYRDFCLEDASNCEDCPFPEQLAQW